MNNPITHSNNDNSNHHNNNGNSKFKFNSKYANILEHYGQWLLSIPRDDIPALMETPEYNLFQEAFHNLELAHRKTLLQHQKYHFHSSHICTSNNTNASALTSSSTTANTTQHCITFLQHLALDDIILRIFEFLPCATLVKTSLTCHRFHILCKKSAKQRTIHMAGHYYLQNEMKLLRAKEQIEGIWSEYKPVVRVPLLGLARRVFVSGSSDEEFNGIYFCTGTNGNGFLFTKPRDQREWTRTRHDRDRNIMMHGNEMIDDEDNNSMIDGDHDPDELIDMHNDNHHLMIQNDLNMNMFHHHDDVAIHDFDRIGNNNDLHQHQQRAHQNNNNNNNNRDLNDNDDDGDETYPLSYYTVKKPRCIISKRFSNEVCYMCIYSDIIVMDSRL